MNKANMTGGDCQVIASKVRGLMVIILTALLDGPGVVQFGTMV